MFMDASDHMILMDMPKQNGQSMTPDELRAFHDAGIQTAHLLIINWDDVEKVEGVYNWSGIDERIGVLNQIGFKVLVSCYDMPAQYFPDSAYVQLACFPDRCCLSPWNSNVQAASLNFYRLMRDRYNTSRSLVVNAYLTVGECVFPNEPAWYGKDALASFHERWNTEDDPVPNEDRTEQWLKETYVNLMVSQNKVLAENEYHEIWTMLHPEIAMQVGLYGNGCKFIDDIYNAYEAEIPGVKINQIWYTFIQHQRQYARYHQLIQRYSLRAYGGAEYCSGLPSSSQKARELGLKGLYIHPLWPIGQDNVEQWMITNVQNALKVIEDL